MELSKKVMEEVTHTEYYCDICKKKIENEVDGYIFCTELSISEYDGMYNETADCYSLDICPRCMLKRVLPLITNKFRIMDRTYQTMTSELPYECNADCSMDCD